MFDSDGFTTHRVKYEDRNLDPIDDYDVYDTKSAALAAFARIVANPDAELGSVYVTADDGDDEHVIASHTFAGDTAEAQTLNSGKGNGATAVQRARRHKLMPTAVARQLPPLYAQDGLGDNAIARAKFFCPWSRYTLYVTEYDGADTLFGYCVSALGSDCDEWGYTSLAELEHQLGPGGAPAIERDKWFAPATVRRAIAERL